MVNTSTSGIWVSSQMGIRLEQCHQEPRALGFQWASLAGRLMAAARRAFFLGPLRRRLPLLSHTTCRLPYGPGSVTVTSLGY